MTEAEWLACGKPIPMLDFLRGKVSDRKLVYFSVAVVRSTRLVNDARVELMLGAAERYADGQLTPLEVAIHWGRDPWPLKPFMWARKLGFKNNSQKARVKEYALSDLARLVHCVFGNPFRPAGLDPAWLTSTAVVLAASIYETRAFRDLPVLADALEDAGCDDAGVLGHLRGRGPHARGCWVVDMVLEKG